MRRSVGLIIGSLVVMAGAGAVLQQRLGLLLVTGKTVTPTGEQQEVGSFPANMVASPDGRFLAVTNTGFRQQLSVLDGRTGKVLSTAPVDRGQGLYYGLAFAQGPSGLRLYVSRGAEDRIVSYQVADDGTLTAGSELSDAAPDNKQSIPNNVAGLAVSPDGQRLYAVNNQTHLFNGMHGSLSVFKIESGERTAVIPTAGFPLSVVSMQTTQGERVFVSSERDGCVTVIDPVSAKTVNTISVGNNATALLADSKGKRLFAVASNSDTVSIVDPEQLKLMKTILLRPAAMRGLPGSTPLGLALSSDGTRLFVAMADLNAVAVVDPAKGELLGYLPTGWYPTSVALSADGSRLFVANAKGVQARTPNGKSVRAWGTYAPAILEGTVAGIDLATALGDLKGATRQVLRNNMASSPRDQRTSFRNPGIEHVIYIIKENRTYDQILGDDPKGNGDPSLTMFGREVTPNHHGLADRFVLLDNFYCCAEVSADGWNWSTAGMANEYTERNTFYNYSGRGRSYDFEGTNNSYVPSERGVRDVAEPEGGYIWDQCVKAGVSYRNYGFFLAFGNNAEGPDGKPVVKDSEPAKPALLKNTCTDFERFDLAYADSEAWIKYGLAAAPRQHKTFGSQSDPSRMSVWLREFGEFVKQRNLPKFSMLRLGRDHTSGTGAGQSSPRAMVADNDYAVGQLVEAVSHSPYWKSTAIFVVEDDAQAGQDHVDCHRSTAYVISPYVKRSFVDSRFYNTDSVLRTMELLLGLKPMNQYDAVASPLDVFSRDATNAEPYNAVLPSKEIVGEVNLPTAYRAKDSQRLLSLYEEDTLPDLQLNDILWGDYVRHKKELAIRGR